MSAEIIPFIYNDKPVRTVSREGEPWFVGKDVCAVLDIRNHKDALSRLDDDERGVAITDPPRAGSLGGGVQEVIIISEAGVYRLVFSSRKAEAEAFKRWLAHEVLPQLRKTGKFAVKSEEAAPLGDEPTERLNAKVNLIRLARSLYGPQRAARLWADLGLPSVPAMPVPDGRDPERALAMLLAAELPDGWNVGEAISVAWENRTLCTSLAECGIRVMFDPDGIAISNTVRFPSSVFAFTEFQNRRWIRILRELPGATTINTRYGDEQTRGTFIPAELLS